VREYQWIADDIFTVTDFLSSAECDAYVSQSESIGFADAPINAGFGRYVVAKDWRDNTRVVTDDSALAGKIWERAKDYVPEVVDRSRVVGLNERFRFYRYDPGQSFKWHSDGCFRRPNGERSKLTFMVYLNDDFDGGETLFENAVIKPLKGMALCFAHPLLHEGAKVVRGRKYVLRTDVMYGPRDL
jgi:predicted 2-oxoglutarate/Fe(II)-dependent dioxygenase YbiX